MNKMHTHYTLVQHSGHRHDSGFYWAVEEAAITTPVQLARVRGAGGLVFTSYEAASRAEYAENYPPEVQGLYPRARGLFSDTVLDGRRIYLSPTREVMHADIAV